MSDKKDSPGDLELFRQAMKGTRPLKTPARVQHEHTRPRPMRRRPDVSEQQDAREWELEDPDHSMHDPGAEDPLRWLRTGYQKRYLSRLKRGHYRIADTLDLHHCIVRDARDMLLAFIADSVAQHRQCIRIVHGKGLRSTSGPRLKIMTNQLLRQHPSVIAFTSCRPAQGGTGAVLVLLKTRPA